MLRGLLPPRSVCGALLLMIKFELLHRGVRALGAIASIRWGAVRLLLGASPCCPGQALVEVVLGDGGVLGVCRRGPGRSLSGLPLDRALRHCRWRKVLWERGAILGCEWHGGKSRADVSSLGGSGSRASYT